MKKGFTLAEVLITLAIIGIVAALTIPGLMRNINNKVVANQKKVMEAKIVQGLNLLNSQENGLTKTYANSEEFVRALSKYMKMTSICGAGNLKDCFAYDRVNYDKNGETKSIELSTLTSASKLKLSSDFLDPAGFVMGDGTPVIVAWNSKCASGAQDATILDPDKPLKSIPTECFDGVYDVNGTRKPNNFTKDVLSFGSAKIGLTCVSNLGNLCITSEPFTPARGLTRDECLEEAAKGYGIEICADQEDYYSAAMKTCYEQGARLATQEELMVIPFDTPEQMEEVKRFFNVGDKKDISVFAYDIPSTSGEEGVNSWLWAPSVTFYFEGYSKGDKYPGTSFSFGSNSALCVGD